MTLKNVLTTSSSTESSDGTLHPLATWHMVVGRWYPENSLNPRSDQKAKSLSHLNLKIINFYYSSTQHIPDTANSYDQACKIDKSKLLVYL